MNAASLDARHMARAVKLAARGLFGTDPNPRVGCVIAAGERVLAEGYHQRAGGPHAEIAALDAAAGGVRGATAYVTLEPCCHHGRTPPCTDALIAAGIGRVVYAVRDPNPRVNGGGAALLRAAGIAVEGGLLEQSSRALNPGFLSRMERGRPWVRLKLAASLDGRTALAGGESRWITSPASRSDVQRLRARASVILTGTGTVLRDDPRLDVRLPGAMRQPLRVVLDSGLGTPPTARILAPPGEALLFAAQGHDPRRAAALEACGARIAALEAGPGGVSLTAAMAYLAAHEANEVHVECGPTLAGALWREALVDEIVLYVAPALLGSGAGDLLALGPLADMRERAELVVTGVRRVGPDLRLTLRPRN